MPNTSTSRSLPFHRRLSTRIAALVLVPLSAVTIIVSTGGVIEQAKENRASLEQQRAMMVEMRQQGVSDVVQAATTALAPLLDRHATITPEVREQAAEILRSIRFEGSNYVFVVDTGGVMRVQSAVPETEGRDMLDAKDAAGRPFIREMLEVGRNGGGVYEYLWAHPDTGENATKHSYVTIIPELDWLVGAGAYTTDIDQAMTEIEAASKAGLVAVSIRYAIAGLLLLVISALGAGFVTRRMSGRITSTVTALQAIAADFAEGQGDLSRRVPVKGKDEIALMASQTNDLLAQIEHILGQVRNTAFAVEQASETVARINDDLASRTDQSAASLQQTSSAMEQITATVHHSSQNADQARQLAHDAANVTKQGESSMTRVEATMGEIRESSRQISDIIQMIDSIAFQTNILALNASVEAARAGEHGRGFAVVAQEVRNLAQRSADASGQIRTLIEASNVHIQGGEQVVQASAQTMRDIVARIERVSGVVNEISEGASEQSIGISQVNTAVGELDGVTQQNASMVQETTHAAADMRRQAEHLTALLAGFTLSAGAPVGIAPPNHGANRDLASVRHQPEPEDWETF
ncbi:methyl-accepting chemotaxis protein [Vreelandella rituensis]|uniref:HAMP domain-containing protein n=1 Tax=Vreelandella rituensis TaxID=2282306 RepID=A0A368UD38_9GAMM|nr:methyl-accepting chemotaxis protein [Halomonas rituensis]RCV93603.1 HAMP domain-containing protein [Halomonas rituensis]